LAIRQQAMHDRLARGPRAETCSDVDVPERPGIDEFRIPGIGQITGACEGHVRIICARNRHRRKRKWKAGDRREASEMVGRVLGGINVRRGDQQRGTNRKVRIFERCVGDENAPQAVCDQERVGKLGNGADQTRHPLIAMRPIPIVLLNASRAGKRSLQAGLPMPGPLAAKAGNYENTSHRFPSLSPSKHDRARACGAFGSRDLMPLPSPILDNPCSPSRLLRRMSPCPAH
jgi:hypothetical protein